MIASSESEHAPTSSDVGASEADPVADRLRWSQPASVRLAQMKKARLHIYVEGKLHDSYYYSKVLKDRLEIACLEADFHLARELDSVGQGKGRCLNFFRFLRDQNCLRSVLGGETTNHLFILDKDIDDEEGVLIDSPHIIYTAHYGVENHIIRESDLCNAIAATSSLDLKRVAKSLGNPNAWLDHCCEVWKDWVAVCILAKMSKCGIANYRMSSKINVPVLAATSPNLLSLQLDAIANKCARSTDVATEELRTLLQRVDERYLSGRHDTLFKGKWYAQFVSEFVKSITGVGSLDERALWAALAASVDSYNSGSDVFRRGLDRLLSYTVTEANEVLTAVGASLAE